MDRDYRDVQTWDLDSENPTMTKEIRLNEPEVGYIKYHGDFVYTDDYKEACYEIDRLRARVEELENELLRERRGY